MACAADRRRTLSLNSCLQKQDSSIIRKSNAVITSYAYWQRTDRALQFLMASNQAEVRVKALLVAVIWQLNL